jgi:CYTH domain-containing protein
MNIEIERKFLVEGDFRPDVVSSTSIVQGYLSLDPERTVRVRITSNQGCLTIKGPPDSTGSIRYEWERKISLEQARELMVLCLPGKIEKTRYRVNFSSCCFEVDEFLGANHGLVVAEIELSDVDQAFERPGWLGAEVTGQARYYNSALTQSPFSSW